jgi:hypothetical protein
MGSPATAAEMSATTTAAEVSAATATSASASGMPTTSTTATGMSATTTTATAAPTCGHRIDRASKGHHRRQEDCTYSNSVVCHNYLLSKFLTRNLVEPKKAS